MIRVHQSIIICTVYFFLSTLILGCTSAPPKPPPVKGGTVFEQKELGPILGPVTKEKVLDRLRGYPICGMEGEEQKLTLKVRVLPLSQDKTQGMSKIDPKVTQGLDRTSLVEIECFFFGVQGLYEFALITPQDGRLYPLAFEGASPVNKKLSDQGQERRGPVARNVGRSEVCGVPRFDAKTRTLSSFCKADPTGACGAYAIYTLSDKLGASDPTGALDAKSAYFKLKSAHFKSCGEPEKSPPETWPEVNLP